MKRGNLTFEVIQSNEFGHLCRACKGAYEEIGRKFIHNGRCGPGKSAARALEEFVAWCGY
ncbi:hypothetical protein ABID12_003062 [Martelella mangrovi]|uniref:Uncharacterized protein n=1 Tax=Martelella mangrovi TaxID=1397477 RepID=A0ABV2IEA0_9HYPH